MNYHLPFKGHQPQYDHTEYKRLERDYRSMVNHVIHELKEHFPPLLGTSLIVKNSSGVLYSSKMLGQVRLQVIADLSEGSLTMAVIGDAVEHTVWCLQHRDIPYRLLQDNDVPIHPECLPRGYRFDYAFQTDLTIENAGWLMQAYLLSHPMDREAYIDYCEEMGDSKPNLPGPRGIIHYSRFR